MVSLGIVGILADGHSGTSDIIYVCSFMLTCGAFLYANYHSFAVVLVTNILIVPLLISFTLQAIIDKCRARYLRAKQEKQTLVNESGDSSRTQTPEKIELGDGVERENSFMSRSHPENTPIPSKIEPSPAPSRLDLYGPPRPSRMELYGLDGLSREPSFSQRRWDTSDETRLSRASTAHIPITLVDP